MPLTAVILALATAFTIGSAFVLLILVHMFRKGLLRGYPGKPGSTGAMGMIGEPSSLLNVCGVLRDVSELDMLCHYVHLDTYIIDGVYWTYMDRADLYERYPEMKRLFCDKTFVVVGNVNGRSAETDYNVGDTYVPTPSQRRL